MSEPPTLAPEERDLQVIVDVVRELSGLSQFSGTWTPVLTFATPGDLSVAYTTQLGEWVKIGQLVTIDFTIQTSSFTFTTASGNLTITGLPFTSKSTQAYIGAMNWQGITKANYTEVSPRVAASSASLTLIASGSGQAEAMVTATDTPSAGTIILRGKIIYST